MTKKKICFVIPYHWSYKFGGSEYQVKLLIDYLIEKDDKKYDLFYVCRINDREIHSPKYKIIRICKGNLGIRKYGYFFDSFDLYKCLKGLNPDLIYQRDGGAYTGVCAYYAKRFGKKMVFHVSANSEVRTFRFKFNRNLLFRYIDKKILQYGIKNTTYIIGQTKYQNDLLKKNFGRDCDYIVPNFHPEPKNEIRKEEPIKIVWVANIKKFKRPELFIKLSEEFQANKEVKFLMIGRKNNGKLQSELENKIAKLSNLNYLGEKSIEQVNRILCHSHIFVHTSLSEGFPNTYIQAWMREIPVVTLNVDPDDLLKKKKIGFHSRSFDQMVKHIRYLIENEDSRKEIGRRAREYAIENHTVEKNGRRYLEIFNNLTKG